MWFRSPIFVTHFDDERTGKSREKGKEKTISSTEKKKKRGEARPVQIIFSPILVLRTVT